MSLVLQKPFYRFLRINQTKSTDECDNPDYRCVDLKESSIKGMDHEEGRLNTFHNFPINFIDKNILARTGMYYTGLDDKCKCFFCDVEIGRWEPSDCPLGEHMRFSQNCPLLRRRQTDNVPIDSNEFFNILPQLSYDICGNGSSGIFNSSFSQDMTSSLDTSINPLTTTNNVGNTSDSYYPGHPEYAVAQARIRSYADWPRTMKQKPAELSEAGFFYTGKGDKVQCFSCGGGLKDWDAEDEPWEQHALWLNNCQYLKLIKGEAYIQSVIDKFKTEDCSSSLDEQTVATSLTPTPASSNNPDIVERETDSTNARETTSSSHESAVAKNTSGPKSSCISKKETATEDVESRNIPDDKLCKICYAAPYNTVFLPCGHVVACAQCALSVTKCPVCRKPFTNIMRLFFP